VDGAGKCGARPHHVEAIEATKRVRGKPVIAKLDRLARNAHFISGLMATGVDFVALDLPTADRFMLHVYAAMVEEEGPAATPASAAFPGASVPDPTPRFAVGFIPTTMTGGR
jgi:hypothetical protein